MNDKQLEKLKSLVALKIDIAKEGGTKPFDEIARWVNQALDEVCEEIRGTPKEQPRTVMPAKGGEEKINPDAPGPKEVEEQRAKEEMERAKKEREFQEKVNQQRAEANKDKSPEEIASETDRRVPSRQEDDARRAAGENQGQQGKTTSPEEIEEHNRRQRMAEIQSRSPSEPRRGNLEEPRR